MLRSVCLLFSNPRARDAGAGVLAASCLALLVAGCGGGPRNESDARPRGEVARLAQRTAELERLLELAGGKDFYLLLDPAAPDLALMLKGAELRRFPVRGLQAGYPRVLWVSRRHAEEWQGVVWTAGELDPPRPTDRLVINAEAPGTGEKEPEPPPVPKTAEELYPVPVRYHVRFAGGLSVEIRPREADTDAGRLGRLRTWWSTKWGDVAAALGSRRQDVVRLRVVLDPKDAESLYRALPPAVRLLVLTH